MRPLFSTLSLCSRALSRSPVPPTPVVRCSAMLRVIIFFILHSSNSECDQHKLRSTVCHCQTRAQQISKVQSMNSDTVRRVNLAMNLDCLISGSGIGETKKMCMFDWIVANKAIECAFSLLLLLCSFAVLLEICTYLIFFGRVLFILHIYQQRQSANCFAYTHRHSISVRTSLYGVCMHV